MTQVEYLLSYVDRKINEYENIYNDDKSINILKNYRDHISKNTKYKDITDDQYDHLDQYFDTLLSLIDSEEQFWNGDVYTGDCEPSMEGLFEFFEGTEVLEKMFKKHNVWAEDEFLDDFEDELYDEENPKWYSYDTENYITNGKIAEKRPRNHRNPWENSYYLWVDKDNKMVRRFSCFDLVIFYVFKREYDEFNKDYTEWVLNNPELQEY